MSKLLKLYPTFVVGASLLPLVAGAQTPQTLSDIIQKISGTLQTIIGVLFVLATVIFLWGVIKFVASAGDETARSKAKGIMTWGIIGLAVMAATWAVVNILVNYFVGTDAGIPRGPRQ
ncbi:MAG: hypothetical protein HYW89_01695 [Candidatus Sungiibacteriota bacterium]|uniref:Conjugal transfer protein TrbC n=1 Tax=Candidatus Sungiibacteriota bacterium TaxID=2750080 RepID=A0A7T5UQX0_9BACT|nr:MAG: hypothetical protein HYW89_01695 [Candidatus Sungbacteria bacterium]